MSRFAPPRRAVVKVGSSSLRGPGGGLDAAFVDDLVEQLVDLRRAGAEVVLVSSGAVAAGLEPLGLAQRPTDLPRLQAAASVGQGILLHTYQAAFAARGVPCGQVLLVLDDVIDRRRYLNARATFEQLLALGAVPVVNENDTVATDELRFGDNDRLAALVASMLGADLLLLLTDVEGVYPGAPPMVTPDDLLHAPAVLDRVDDLAAVAVQGRAPGSSVGTGGIATKLEAARIATFSAAHVVIAAARRDGVVGAVAAGEPIGTWFPPAARRPDSRKLWLAFAHDPRGAVVVDDGAVRALVQRGSSLLAAGIVGVAGSFEAGDAVEVVGPDAMVVARGRTTYASDDVARIKGRTSDDLVAELGEAFAREVIHRDWLVVTA